MILGRATAGARAQEVHYAQVQDMNTWYNPALKINKLSLASVNFQSVKYKGITSYTSKAATLELPLSGLEEEYSGFLSLAAGINTNSNSEGTMDLSTGMLSLSYALPLNYDNTYLAAGLQGAYTFSRIAYSYNYFPDKFDAYGPIASTVFVDPLETGNRYTYFTAGAGAAFFHNGEERQWYIGGSIGHINQPLTHPGLPESRLLVSQGIQAGYTTALTTQSTVGGYAVFTWQHGGYEHIIGARYSRSLGDSANTTFFGGMGYRIHDALIPHIGFSTGSHRLTFHYEINPFASTARNYHRQSFDLSYRYLF